MTQLANTMPPPLPPDRPLRVLVVDDTVTYRQLVSRLLADLAGVEVVGAAANGRIAIQKIEQTHPDLLLLDLEMPEMDGLEVLRRLRATSSEIGAIMLSGFTEAGANATLEALKLGAFDFVLKPRGDSFDANTRQLRDELRPKLEAFARNRTIQRL
ncbi:MAG: response regulator, partial [Patescibacteria group bacterium]|nr:response regulator [Patescibacteria group bacterium]